MTHVTCRLTAKHRDQLWKPTLGNRVRATFTFSWSSKERGASRILSSSMDLTGYLFVFKLAVLCLIQPFEAARIQYTVCFVCLYCIHLSAVVGVQDIRNQYDILSVNYCD